LPAAILASPENAWTAYKKKFVSDDGRVIDFYQESMSHSEGQGYGLLLSLMHNDQPTFERVLKWSIDNLQVRSDALFAWAWGKRSNGSWTIIDYNNASDGDILIALALLRAGQKWNNKTYETLALKIIKEIRMLLATRHNGASLILPAYYGFEKKKGIILNPGYLIFPAFSRFAAVDDSKFWKKIHTDGTRIIKQARFSRFKLPADWILLQNGDLSVYASKSTAFGYEAIRVPLYIIWDSNKVLLKFFSPYLQFIEKSYYLPNWVNLVDGSISVDEAPAGFHSVLGRCAALLGLKALNQKLQKKAEEKIKHESKDYYSHTLYLLSQGSLD
jgi:endoglucanase